jgi:phosphatidylglycerophosphate synthase
VARAYNQCTIFGSGIDWLADVQAQIIIMVWCVLLDARTFPLLMFITTIELGMCIFDYATTATGRYPILESPTPYFVYKILDWSMPRGAYNWFGIFLWLAYPTCILSFCLDMSWSEKSFIVNLLLKTTEITLFIPMILYAWCEFAQLVHIVSKWNEAPRKKVQ